MSQFRHTKESTRDIVIFAVSLHAIAAQVAAEIVADHEEDVGAVRHVWCFVFDPELACALLPLAESVWGKTCGKIHDCQVSASYVRFHLA